MTTASASRPSPAAEQVELLRGKVALVSGAGRGLGRLLATRLAEAGAAVGLIARSRDQLSATAEQIRHTGANVALSVADLTDWRATAAAVDELRHRLGPPAVLVNNAGASGPLGPLGEVDPVDWWRTIEINLGGAFFLTRLVLPDMVQAGSGRIVNITSHAGVHRWPQASAYATSKAALIKLTETLDREIRPHGVFVFSVDPGLLRIGLGELALKSTLDASTPEGRVLGWVRSRIESGYAGDPDRAAGLVVALAGGKADRLSGRHLRAGDDLQDLLTRIEEIERYELHALRLRTHRNGAEP